MAPGLGNETGWPCLGKNMIMISRLPCLAPLLALTMSYAANADITDALSSAAKDGTAKFNIRYRVESVDQDGITEDALASTAKARFSWVSGAANNFSVGIETDYVVAIGDDQYNSTDNGRTTFPVVADPEGFDLNQAFVKYKQANVTATLGRQRIVHGGQRFVGGVAWRQNEQTYDALRLQLAPVDGFSLDYSYVFNVNRIFGPDGGAQPADWDSESHFILAKYAISKQHSLTGFAYLLDFSNANGIPNSTSTYGVDYAGAFGAFKLAASYASQSDYGDSPLDYSADYYAVSASYKIKPVNLTVGYEVLGSDDGVAAFRTPLATLHKFQGWADKFLGTPAAGIEDLYLGVAGAVGKLKLAATFHDYTSNEGSSDLGSEINIVATLPLHKTTSVQLKFADYSADNHATDTTKIWVTLNFAI